MAQVMVKLPIPFDSLIEAVRELGFEEKYQLWELLEEQIAQLEEHLLEKDTAVQAQIQEARIAYQSGDYETIDEYVARRKSTTS
jgi:hypothetical protein